MSALRDMDFGGKVKQTRNFYGQATLSQEKVHSAQIISPRDQKAYPTEEQYNSTFPR